MRLQRCLNQRDLPHQWVMKEALRLILQAKPAILQFPLIVRAKPPIQRLRLVVPSVAKYNQLLRIEEALGNSAVYPKMGAFNVKR